MAKVSGVSLDDVIKNMNKKAGEVIVTKGLSEYNYERIPFTSPRMNYCTYGGLPVGKIIEFFGEEHGGKTTTALDIIANYQQMEGAKKVLYIDAENTLDTEWAQKLGVVTGESFIVLQPKSQSAEEIFQFIVDAVETGEVGLWVLDSIGVLLSQQEFEKSIEEKTYAGISKPLTLFSKRVEQAMHGNKCTGIGINQIRENLASQWGGVTTPGGKGWRHTCSVRIQFSRGSFYDDKGNNLSRGAENPYGNMVQVNMCKNKTCPPKRHITAYSLNYDDGVDYIKDLVELAVAQGFINKRGGWFDIIDIETGEVLEKVQGQANIGPYLQEHEEVLEKLENSLDKVINNE